MGRPKKHLTLDEILDIVIPMLPNNKQESLSFNDWTNKVITEIRANPRVQLKESRWTDWTTSGTTTSEVDVLLNGASTEE